MKREIYPSEGRLFKVLKDGTRKEIFGNIVRGYVQVTIGSKGKYLHRVIWEHVNGEVAEGMQIDHINGNPLDNRIENLRLVTSKQNNENRHRHCGISGKKGVFIDKRTLKKPYRASICHNRKTIFLGYFEDAESAHKAYAKAAASLHTHNPDGGLYE